MEFIKVGKNYMIKGGNGRIISEKEKLLLENNELILKDIKGCGSPPPAPQRRGRACSCR